MSLAVITVSGHLGRDADLRFTSGGQPILSFSVAASHYQGSGEQRTEHTDWYAVALFGPRGEALQRYLLKGTRVTVVGRLSHRHYTRQDGTPGCSLDIVANEIDFSTPRERGPGRHCRTGTSATAHRSPSDRDRRQPRRCAVLAWSPLHTPWLALSGPYSRVGLCGGPRTSASGNDCGPRSDNN